MNKKSFSRSLVLFLFTLLVAAPLAVAEEIPLFLAAGSSLLVEGKSTMHEYESKNTAIRIDSAVSASAAVNTTESAAGGPLEDLVNRSQALSPKVSRLKLTVPVSEFRSPVKALDGNFRKTLKADQFPEIVFVVESSSPAVSGKSNQLVVRASGSLTIAGQTKKIEVAAAVRLSGKTLAVSGAKELLMSDYGIKPPVMFGGMLKTEDKVVIKWNLVFAASAAAAAPSKKQ